MAEDTPNILFVDNDQTILDSFKKLLTDESWSCHFVQTAQQALEIIAAEQINLLVSNVELPEMDGIELLRIVSEKNPEIVRIFLTRVSRDEKTVKALSAGYAQQIIPKPWIDQELKEIIRSALRQSSQQKKYSPQFQKLINSMPLLPALPESYTQVQSCIMDDDVDIEKMADIIGQDIGLSTTMLHWANSALFGQRFRVDTIKKAIVVLGTDIVSNLILSEAVVESFSHATCEANCFNLKAFRKHSMATAILARLLIKSVHASNTNLQDRAFIAGLLHDLGKLVATTHFSKKFSAATQLAKQQNCLLFEAEQKLFGTTHAEIGSFLAEWWALPHFIVATISSHHTPRNSLIDPEIVAAVYVANQLSYRFGFGCNGETADREIESYFEEKFFLTAEGLEILNVETEELISVLCSQNS